MDVARDAGFRRGLACLLLGIAMELGGVVAVLVEIARGTPGYPSGLAVVGFGMMVVGLFLAFAGSLPLLLPSVPK